jgi:hypothetical protein
MEQNEVNHQRQADMAKSFNRLFINWLGWKVILPLCLISSLYLLIRFIMEIPHPFGKAFAHGDLLIFSALVLLEAATEGEYNQEQSVPMEVARILAKIFAILFIGGFVATKYDILDKENQLLLQHASTTHEMLAKKMLAYSCLNCTVALVSVGSSIMLFWFNVNQEKKQQFANLAQQTKV